jgi:hypothetical protein
VIPSDTGRHADRRVARRPRMYAGLAAGAIGLGSLAYVGLVDPHRPGSIFPPCPFKMLTGWDCPACGGLRMTNDVLHGNLPAAVADNVFLLAGLPLLAIWSLWRIRRGRRVLTPAFLVLVVVAATVWTVARNLPGFPLVPTMLGP